MKPLTILISGAGIAGTALACFLRERGFEPVIVERAPQFRIGGYMIDFWGVGMDVAERMGILPRLREVGYRIERMLFVREDESVRSEMGVELFARSLGDRFISLPRGDLAQAIHERLGEEVEIRYDESVLTLAEDAEGVEVTFEKAPAQRFDLVVGCDGLHSAGWAAAFGKEEEYEKYLGYQTASFVTDNYSRRDEQTYLSFGAPGRQISRYALRGGRSAFFFVFACDRAERVQNPRELLRETFAPDRWVELPEIFAHLERCNDLYYDAVSQIRMPRWSRGRCVLLGDAAYCPSLLAGEGASFAMVGAYLLAGELAQAQGDYARAFAAYEERFRPFIEGKQRTAARFARSFAPSTRFGLWARDQVLHLAARFQPVADWLMRWFVTDDLALPDYRP